MKNSTIETIPELVAAFGGTGKMAEFVGVVPSAVSNWIAENAIPRGYHLQLYLEVQARGMSVDLELFGMQPRGKADAAPLMAAT